MYSFKLLTNANTIQLYFHNRKIYTCTIRLIVFKRYFYCISSDFYDLQDMPDDCINLSMFTLDGLSLYILYLTYTK